MEGFGNLVPRSPTAKGKGDLTFQCKTEWDLGTRLGFWFTILFCLRFYTFRHIILKARVALKGGIAEKQLLLIL